MRKAIAGLATLAFLAALAYYGAEIYLPSRQEASFRAALDGLPETSSASFGALEVSLVRKTAVFSDARFSYGDGVAHASASRIELSSPETTFVDWLLFNVDEETAWRIRVSDLALTQASGERVTVDRLEAREVGVGGLALGRGLHEADPDGAARGISFGNATLTGVRHENGADVMSVRNISLHRLEGGRLGHLELSAVAFEVNGAQGSIGALEMEGIDVLAVLQWGRDPGAAAGGFWSRFPEVPVSSSRISEVVLRDADGRLDIDRLDLAADTAGLLEELAIDALGFEDGEVRLGIDSVRLAGADLAGVMAARSLLTGSDGGHDDVLEDLSTVLRSISISEFSIAGAEVKHRDLTLGGELAMSGYTAGRLDEFALRNIQIEGRDRKAMRLGFFTVLGMDLAGLIERQAVLARFGTAGGMAEIDREAIVETLSPVRVEEVGLADLEFVEGEDRLFGLAHLRWAQSGWVEASELGRLPTRVDLAVEGVEIDLAAIAPTAEARRRLDAIGYAELFVTLEAHSEWESQTGKASGMLEVEVADAGRLMLEIATTSLSLDQFLDLLRSFEEGPEVVGFDQFLLLVLKDLALDELRLRFVDASLVGRLLRFGAEMQGMDVARMRAEVMAQVELQRLRYAGDPTIARVLGALSEFVGEPGSIELRLRPPEPFGFAHFMAFAQNPPALVRSLGLEVESNR